MSRPPGYYKKQRATSPYYQSDKYRIASRARAARYDKNNRIKRTCRCKFQRAVKAGKVTRPDHCTNCGLIGKPEAHHPDYSKPFEVIWLCKACHFEADRLNKARSIAP